MTEFIMTDHFIGSIDSGSDGVIDITVITRDTDKWIEVSQSHDLVWCDAARVRALAAMLHAAADHVERLQNGVTQPATG